MVDVPTAPKVNELRVVSSSALYYGFSAPLDNGGASVTDYYVEYSTNLNFTGVTTTSMAPPGGTLTGLSRAKQYYVRSRCRNSKGFSPYSVVLYATTYAELPSAPNPFYIDAQGAHGIHYKFYSVGDNGGVNIDEYQVSYGTGTDPNAQSIFTVTLNGGVGDIYINGCSRYTQYYVWARARNSAGWGPWSNTYGIRTQGESPQAPSPASITDISQVSFVYNFNDNDSGGPPILERQVGWSKDPNNIQSTTSANSGVTISALSPATLYYVWSRIRTQEGWSPWSARTQLKTIAGARLWISNTVVEAIPYVKVDGTWKLAQPFIKRVGLWKKVL